MGIALSTQAFTPPYAELLPPQPQNGGRMGMHLEPAVLSDTSLRCIAAGTDSTFYVFDLDLATGATSNINSYTPAALDSTTISYFISKNGEYALFVYGDGSDYRYSVYRASTDSWIAQDVALSADSGYDSADTDRFCYCAITDNGFLCAVGDYTYRSMGNDLYEYSYYHGYVGGTITRSTFSTNVTVGNWISRTLDVARSNYALLTGSGASLEIDGTAGTVGEISSVTTLTGFQNSASNSQTYIGYDGEGDTDGYFGIRVRDQASFQYGVGYADWQWQFYKKAATSRLDAGHDFSNDNTPNEYGYFGSSVGYAQLPEDALTIPGYGTFYPIVTLAPIYSTRDTGAGTVTAALVRYNAYDEPGYNGVDVLTTETVDAGVSQPSDGFNYWYTYSESVVFATAFKTSGDEYRFVTLYMGGTIYRADASIATNNRDLFGDVTGFLGSVSGDIGNNLADNSIAGSVDSFLGETSGGIHQSSPPFTAVEINAFVGKPAGINFHNNSALVAYGDDGLRGGFVQNSFTYLVCEINRDGTWTTLSSRSWALTEAMLRHSISRMSGNGRYFAFYASEVDDNTIETETGACYVWLYDADTDTWLADKEAVPIYNVWGNSGGLPEDMVVDQSGNVHVYGSEVATSMGSTTYTRGKITRTNGSGWSASITADSVNKRIEHDIWIHPGTDDQGMAFEDGTNIRGWLTNGPTTLTYLSNRPPDYLPAVGQAKLCGSRSSSGVIFVGEADQAWAEAYSGNAYYIYGPGATRCRLVADGIAEAYAPAYVWNGTTLYFPYTNGGDLKLGSCSTSDRSLNGDQLTEVYTIQSGIPTLPPDDVIRSGFMGDGTPVFYGMSDTHIGRIEGREQQQTGDKQISGAVTNFLAVADGAVWQASFDHGLSGAVQAAMATVNGSIYKELPPADHQLSGSASPLMAYVAGAGRNIGAMPIFEASAEFRAFTLAADGKMFPMTGIVIRTSLVGGVVERDITITLPPSQDLFVLLDALSASNAVFTLAGTRLFGGVETNDVIASGFITFRRESAAARIIGSMSAGYTKPGTKSIPASAAISWGSSSARVPMDLGIEPGDTLTGLRYDRKISAVTHYLYANSPALSEVFF